MRRLVLPAIAALLGILILLGLGAWQVARLQWKEALIARVDARLDAPPVAAPGPEQWPTLDLAEIEYQPVAVRGRFLNDREIHVVYTLTAPNGPQGGVGYLVMTPFVADAGWTVFVDRGFVPRDRKDPATRKAGLIEGETAVVGLLRQASERSWYTPRDNLAGNEWFSRDPKLYAAAEGMPLADVAPYLIDARSDAALPGGLPQGGETIVAFPNSHLQYAVTWFGLALALAVVFFFFARGRIGGRSA